MDIFLPEFCNNSFVKSENFKKSDFAINSNQNIVNDDFKITFGQHALSDCICNHSKSCQVCSAVKNISSKDIENKIMLHEIIKHSGKYNFEGCRIPLDTKINVSYFREMLFDYRNNRICDFLEFGFPLDFRGDVNEFPLVSEIWKYKNHKGAIDFPQDMIKYLQKESENQAILGPFKKNPFSTNLIISPLNSVPKKDSSERRVIVDLSFPKSHAINDFISKEDYLGESTDLIFPKVDDFVQLIKSKGRGCLLFKKDLRRAYRQIPICPSSYSLVAYVWNKHIFCDCVLTMGLRNAASICQSVTNAVVFILFKLGIMILNYLDDLAGAETKSNAQFAYDTLGMVLSKCGLEEAKDKACPPSEVMIFLGILFNTVSMTMEVTEERLQEIRDLVILWLHYDSVSLKQIQSLIGKLNFVASCVKPSRIFISRLLQWLRSIDKTCTNSVTHKIPNYVKKDLVWWQNFLPRYNGISLMSYEEWSSPDEIFSSDSCLSGCGGFWKGAYFHSVFPEEIMQNNWHISALEMLSIIVCLRLWGSYFKGLKIIVFCDNEAVCTVINTGKTKCEILQEFLREICFLAAVYEFELRTVHLTSSENRICDHLSRWHEDVKHSLSFLDLTKSFHLKEYYADEGHFKLLNNW